MKVKIIFLLLLTVTMAGCSIYQNQAPSHDYSSEQSYDALPEQTKTRFADIAFIDVTKIVCKFKAAEMTDDNPKRAQFLKASKTGLSLEVLDSIYKDDPTEAKRIFNLMVTCVTTDRRFNEDFVVKSIKKDFLIYVVPYCCDRYGWEPPQNYPQLLRESEAKNAPVKNQRPIRASANSEFT